MKMTVEQARASGYCITSRKHRMASRLDTPEWRQRLAASHPGGDGWVERLGPRNAADFYRRCISKDQITVQPSWIAKLGNSNEGPTEYLK